MEFEIIYVFQRKTLKAYALNTLNVSFLYRDFSLVMEIWFKVLEKSWKSIGKNPVFPETDVYHKLHSQEKQPVHNMVAVCRLRSVCYSLARFCVLQQDVSQRRKEEGHQAVPLSQGGRHLPRGKDDEVLAHRHAQIPHWHGGAGLHGSRHRVPGR